MSSQTPKLHSLGSTVFSALVSVPWVAVRWNDLGSNPSQGAFPMSVDRLVWERAARFEGRLRVYAANDSLSDVGE